MYRVATLMPVIDSQVPPEPSGQYSLAGVQLTSLCWVCGGKMEPALDMCATCRVQMEEGGGRDWLSKKLGLKETSMEDGRGAGAGQRRGVYYGRGDRRSLQPKKMRVKSAHDRSAYVPNGYCLVRRQERGLASRYMCARVYRE